MEPVELRILILCRIIAAGHLAATRESIPELPSTAAISAIRVASPRRRSDPQPHPGLERSGVSLVASSIVWNAALQPIVDIVTSSMSNGARRTDIAWYQNPRCITEVTVIPQPGFRPLFAGDLGAIVSRQPPRTPGSHYWSLTDYLTSPWFMARVTRAAQTRICKT